MKSEFLEWFVAQHGKRPFNGKSDLYLEMAYREGQMAVHELEKRREWDVRKESSLYAWQVKPDKCQ
jgi:hypothetical protein